MITEVRIGNIVMLNGVTIKVDLDFFKNYTKHYKLKGLKLTESLLMDLNYRKQINTEWVDGREVEDCPYYFDTQLPMNLRISGIYEMNGKFRILGGYVRREVECLHQLQNIFFTMSGVELIITDKIMK